MSIFKDFLGLNYGLYEPIADDQGTAGINFIGYDLTSSLKYSDLPTNNSNIGRGTTHDSSRTMILLNLHRNGPYGYPTWKQVRTAQNHLTRYQVKRSIFTYVDESSGRFGEIKQFQEPTVAGSFMPIALVGDVRVYNDRMNEFQNRSIEIKTSFGNETIFFANNKINEDYGLIKETDEGYEDLTELYLDGGLEDDGSPLEAFNLLIYKQTVFPKIETSFLNRTRSRTYYVNKFWRDDRIDRNSTNVDGGFGINIPTQSMWPLDAAVDFNTRQPDDSSNGTSVIDYTIGGDTGYDSQGGEGLLSNTFSSLTPRFWNDNLGSFGINNGRPSFGSQGIVIAPIGTPNAITHSIGSFLTASAFYSRPHTLKNKFSVANPSGPRIAERDYDLEDPNNFPYSLYTSSLFQGNAPWTAGELTQNSPFYDSYADYAAETRVIGKGYSTVPEFRISSHVDKYLVQGITSENKSIFEMSGAAPNPLTNTENKDDFYKILATSDFLKHFDLVKKDHKDLARESVITLRCKGLKKFLPYEGFYPADRTSQMSKQFYDSYESNIQTAKESSALVHITDADQFAKQAFLTPICAPGILFNTIKSGIAVDFPIITQEDFVRDQADEILNSRIFTSDDGRIMTNTASNVKAANVLLSTSQRIYDSTDEEFSRVQSVYSKRIPFEALLNPENYLAGESMTLQEPHPFGLSDFQLTSVWDGKGDSKFKKMMSNFLAEVPDFFLKDSSFKILASEEEGDPNFGNVIEGNYYVMRIKMVKTLERLNSTMNGYEEQRVFPPQDMVSFSDESEIVRENFTMYSRPSAFGPPSHGGGGSGSLNSEEIRIGSLWGYNFPYTPPYYHGESWCDVIYKATRTGKVTLDEIMTKTKEFPYYTRYWTPLAMDAFRDTMGKNQLGRYSNFLDDEAPWLELLSESRGVVPASSEINYAEDLPTIVEMDLTSSNKNYSVKNSYVSYQNGVGGIGTIGSSPAAGSPVVPPQSVVAVNQNAMQLDASINLFGKGLLRKSDSDSDPTTPIIEVASSDTVRGKTRWIIQPKFECPMLNFNKYGSLSGNGLESPNYGASQVPRGMWHQHGDIPESNEGVFLQVSDIPESWLVGALGVERGFVTEKVHSLADVVGFSKERTRLGELSSSREISEAVVAVPFIESDGTRKFFSIDRKDIDSCINASKREVSPGTFPAGGPPKAGGTIYNMVKKMQKFVFPPSMDFVKYQTVDPFAMYVFEFKHRLSKEDLSNIWQNCKPEIGSKVEHVEASISHELLAHELLGTGAVLNDGSIDNSVKSKGIPSNIQWMVFKVKKRSKTDYFEKVIQKPNEKPSTMTPTGFSNVLTEKDSDISYNWPYDFFSLVELVKIDAEVTFANIENDDKGQKTIKKVEKKSSVEMLKDREAIKNINIARGKGKSKK